MPGTDSEVGKVCEGTKTVAATPPGTEYLSPNTGSLKLRTSGLYVYCVSLLVSFTPLPVALPSLSLSPVVATISSEHHCGHSVSNMSSITVLSDWRCLCFVSVLCVCVCVAEGSGVIIVVIILCLLLLGILGSVLYFLHKKGKIPCGRSGKQEMWVLCPLSPSLMSTQPHNTYLKCWWYFILFILSAKPTMKWSSEQVSSV